MFASDTGRPRSCAWACTDFLICERAGLPHIAARMHTSAPTFPIFPILRATRADLTAGRTSSDSGLPHHIVYHSRFGLFPSQRTTRATHIKSVHVLMIMPASDTTGSEAGQPQAENTRLTSLDCKTHGRTQSRAYSYRFSCLRPVQTGPTVQRKRVPTPSSTRDASQLPRLSLQVPIFLLATDTHPKRAHADLIVDERHRPTPRRAAQAGRTCRYIALLASPAIARIHAKYPHRRIMSCLCQRHGPAQARCELPPLPSVYMRSTHVFCARHGPFPATSCIRFRAFTSHTTLPRPTLAPSSLFIYFFSFLHR